ncbi:hypothetical protein F511_19092 [Dorcoceras hygrometricum]|uniref:Uncharacterized protein n=1 Tax=Dorcoceras hygrometricum TaxID=472368 RepID=A0A2Z7BRJ5_9LAMI|nr:hypothetical protein F511_19092 [Dorcoceras hygrometricum]
MRSASYRCRGREIETETTLDHQNSLNFRSLMEGVGRANWSKPDSVGFLSPRPFFLDHFWRLWLAGRVSAKYSQRTVSSCSYPAGSFVQVVLSTPILAHALCPSVPVLFQYFVFLSVWVAPILSRELRQFLFCIVSDTVCDQAAGELPFSHMFGDHSCSGDQMVVPELVVVWLSRLQICVVRDPYCGNCSIEAKPAVRTYALLSLAIELTRVIRMHVIERLGSSHSLTCSMALCSSLVPILLVIERLGLPGYSSDRGGESAGGASRGYSSDRGGESAGGASRG